MACRASAFAVVEQGREPVARSLAQAYVAGYHGVEHHLCKMAFQLFVYLVGEPQAGVVHSEQESLDFQFGV